MGDHGGIEQGMSSPAASSARKLIEDEARFIDFRHSRVFMTEEHQIFSQPIGTSQGKIKALGAP